MDTSKPITPSVIVAASPEDIASLTTRHVYTLFKRWMVTEAYTAYHDSIYDGIYSVVPLNEDEIQLGKAVEILRKELGNRPHVPNKREAKEQRRLAAKRGR